jgi:uroporphyrinogen decarboxylase
MRQKYDFLTMCKKPDLAVEVTLQPIKKFNMDIAILFSDILTALEPMGIGLSFSDEKGPEINFMDKANYDKLNFYDIEESLSFVPESLRILRRELGEEKGLLGFSGAPFTLASYLLEGKHKRTFNSIQKMMMQNPLLLEKILEKLAIQMGRYLAAQIIAGADGVQLFDSWAGNLPLAVYRQFVLKYQKLTFDTLKEELGKSDLGKEILKKGNYFTILFVKNFSGPIQVLTETGADVISIDETRDILEVRNELKASGKDPALQGNFSPYSLYADPATIEKNTKELCCKLNGKGHIVNLGHGVFPDITEQSVATFVDTVRNWKKN